MIFACEACGSSFKYNSDRGLRQHQLHCEEFLLADNEASTVDDALEKYRRKLQKKKKLKALSEVPLTGSGVTVCRDGLKLFFLCSSFIVGYILHGYGHWRYRRESHIGTGT